MIHVFIHFSYNGRIQAPNIGGSIFDIGTLISTTCIRLWFSFHFLSLRTYMNYLSNYNRRIQAPKKWGLAIDIGTPYFTSCIRLWFLDFSLLPTYINNQSNIYRSPLVASKSVDKHASYGGSKEALKIDVFPPWCPLLRFFEISFFRKLDHVESNRMPFEFWKSDC